MITDALGKIDAARSTDKSQGEIEAMQWDEQIDCLGMLCPLPVLRARKVLAGMQVGQVLQVLASDAMAAVDLPHFCAHAGHEFLGQSAVEGGSAYLIRCGKGPAS